MPQVQHEIQVRKGEVIGIDDEDSDKEVDPDANVSRLDIIDLVAQLEILNGWASSMEGGQHWIWIAICAQFRPISWFSA